MANRDSTGANKNRLACSVQSLSKFYALDME